MKPTVARLLELFNYNSETGDLIRRLTTNSRSPAGTTVGCGGCSYQQVQVDGWHGRIHRVVWAMHYGKWPEFEIDHINGVKSDNRIANLRDVQKDTNQQNQTRAHKRSSTGVLGVSAHRKGFTAFIGYEGKNLYLGSFKNIPDAQQAYESAKRRLHKGCTL